MSGWRRFDRRCGRLVAVVITVIVALVLVDRASLLVAPCGVGGGGYSDQKNPNDDNCAVREGIIIAGIEWLSDRSPETWTAIASLAIAIFTLTLWRSTDKLWNSAEKQFQHLKKGELQAFLDRADDLNRLREQINIAKESSEAAKLNAEAVIETERARIFVHIGTDNAFMVLRAANIEAAVADEPDTFKMSNSVFVEYRLKNYGRTPAIIKEISHQLICAPKLEKMRRYTPILPLPIDHILGGDQKTPQNRLSCRLDRALTIGDAKQIQRLDSALWFYGYVSYDDTFGWGRELRYVFHYDGSTGGSFRLYSYRETQSDKRHGE